MVKEDTVKEIKLEDYKNVIHTLVWKFRNLGFADALYAPITVMGMEARVTHHFESMSREPEERKVSFTVTNFEDLISEGYLIFTELKNAHAQGKLENLNFEQALVTRLESHFLHLFEAIQTQKRKAHVRSLNEEDEQIPYNITPSFWEKMKSKVKDLPLDKQLVVRAILNGDIKESTSGRITKRSIYKYLASRKWSQKKIQEFLATIPV